MGLAWGVGLDFRRVLLCVFGLLLAGLSVQAQARTLELRQRGLQGEATFEMAVELQEVPTRAT